MGNVKVFQVGGGWSFKISKSLMFLFLMKYNFILSGSKAKTEKKKNLALRNQTKGMWSLHMLLG